METMTCQEAEKQLSQMIAQASQSREQFLIRGDEGAAVLISEETYNNLIVTLEVLSTPRLLDPFCSN